MNILFEKRSILIYFQINLISCPFFYTRHPILTITMSGLIAVVCMVPAVIDYKEETLNLELWVPRDSNYYKNAKWLEENFPSTARYLVVLLETTENENILKGKHIRRLFHLHSEIREISSKNGANIESVCTKWPNPWTQKDECAENSLLEIWAQNGSYEKTNATIWGRSDTQLLNDINNAVNSGIFNFPVSLNHYLGSVEKKGSRIEKAQVLRLSVQLDLDPTNLKESKKTVMDFEKEFIIFMSNYSTESDGKKLNVYYFAQRSIDDVANESMGGDQNLLSMGFAIVFMYVIIMLGKFNSVEQRGYLSLLGILSIILGTATSYGICQFLGLVAGPLHGILPFLLLGIGIDDMFVIVQCWDVLESKYRAKQKSGGREDEDSIPLADRFGQTMSSAGGAITVTSLTDIIGE